MLGWLAITITWLAALVAAGKDLKTEKDSKVLSWAFLEANRFPVATALLASFGLVVGGIALESGQRKATAERLRADQAQARLAELLEESKQLSQDIATFAKFDPGAEIMPIYELFLDSNRENLADRYLSERAEWRKTRPPDSRPLTVGFLSSDLIEMLLPGWAPNGDEVSDRIAGSLTLRSGLWKIQLMVHSDGSVVPTGSYRMQNIRELETRVDQSRAVLRFVLRQPYSALSIWRDLEQRSTDGKPLLLASVNRAVDSSASLETARSPIDFQLRVFLTNKPEVVASVRLSPEQVASANTTDFAWLAVDRPRVDTRAVPQWAMVHHVED